ncbi:unnamed protein product [Mytilus coruscus]|uniref:C2H2-type domain-containing protein n=1 Tax=Mytilus coruscus TaxID=42192 RepID=A0A6J8EWE6_MYTCO|nr:unnamed protein product [Mytilus coruscus]
MYELPREVKSIPANKWVWELQERMEDAHQFVQNHVNREILRQKQYHDKHLSWNTFNKNDKVFVFFPVREPLLGERLQGLEPSNQVSEMNDQAQVVGESASIDFDFENRYETIEQDEHINLPRLRRERKPPLEKELEDHVLACVKKRSSEEEYLCDLCPYATSRKSDFTRHQRRRHAASLSAIDDTDSEWEKQNPGTLSDVLWRTSEIQDQHNKHISDGYRLTYQRQRNQESTSPLPVANPSRKRLLDTLKSSLGPQPIASKRFVLP